MNLSVEQVGADDTGRCECCSRMSRKVWGLVRCDGYVFATYFVHWTVGHVFDHGANFDVILGKWGEGTTSADRYAVRLEYRVLDDGPSMMIRDSDRKYVGALADHCLKRSDVISDPLANMVFAICDAFLAQDSRLVALWGAPSGS